MRRVVAFPIVDDLRRRRANRDLGEAGSLDTVDLQSKAKIPQRVVAWHWSAPESAHYECTHRAAASILLRPLGSTGCSTPRLWTFQYPLTKIGSGQYGQKGWFMGVSERRSCTPFETGRPAECDAASTFSLELPWCCDSL